MTGPNNASLRKVTLHAARSKEFPDGSIRHGYDFIAPLTADGHIDLEAWKAHRGECFAHRFWAGEPTIAGPPRPSRRRPRRLDLGLRMEVAARRRRRGGRLPLRRPRVQGRRVRLRSRARGRAPHLPGGRASASREHIPEQDQPTSRRNAIRAALTSLDRSCCVQWPQPGSMTVFVRLGTNSFRFEIS